MRHIALTSVDQPRRQMGELALELLEQRRHRPELRGRVRTVRPHLVERSSTAPVRRAQTAAA
jgi:DNA-binding LacI/PurR family transcriptional regulator